MFKFLKDKIKKAISKITKSAEEDVIEEKADAQEIAQAKKEERIQKATELEDTVAAKEHRKKIVPKKPAPKKPSIQKTKPEPKETVTEKPKPAAVVPEVTEEVSEPVVEEPTPAEEVQEPDVVEEPVEEVVPEEPVEEIAEPIVEEPAPKSFLKKVFGKKEKVKEATPEIVSEAVEETVEEIVPEVEVAVPDEPVIEEVVPEVEPPVEVPEKKSFLGKISETFTKKRLTEEKFAELFWDLELTLLENSVAVEVIEKIKGDMQQDLTTGKVTRKGIDQLIIDSLRTSIESLFVEPYDLVKKVKQSNKRPYIITVIGVNGCGKTTTLAKIANLFQENDLKIVMAASDTFRAAAIDQLKEHANNLGIKLISQGYDADPAAVAFDAIKHAEAQNIDVVLIDTAGRLHSNTNLMAELEKVVRVAKPDLKLFVGESITGNDCVEQATEFDKAVGIDAIILSKADVDEKGGAAISVSYVTGKPILYLGVGQAYGDLRPFDAERIVRSLGLA